jgi:hypothetical protein
MVDDRRRGRRSARDPAVVEDIPSSHRGNRELGDVPATSPSVIELVLSVSAPSSLNVVVPPMVRADTVVALLASSVPALLIVALENASVPVSVSSSPLETLTVAARSLSEAPRIGEHFGGVSVVDEPVSVNARAPTPTLPVSLAAPVVAVSAATWESPFTPSGRGFGISSTRVGFRSEKFGFPCLWKTEILRRAGGRP